MSIGDYKDRLRTYTLEAEPSDWAKMEQLLNADNRRKPVAWWKFFALALFLLSTSFLLSKGISYGFNSPSDEKIDEPVHMAMDPASSSNNLEDSKSIAAINPTSTTENKNKEIKEVPLVVEDSKSEIIKPNLPIVSNLTSLNESKVDVKNMNEQQALGHAGFLAMEYASKPLVNDSDIDATASQTENKIGLTVSENLTQEQFLDCKAIAKLENNFFDIRDRNLDLSSMILAEVPVNIEQQVTEKRPWFLAGGIAAKFTQIKFDETQEYVYTPETIKLPVYSGELSLGKNLTKNFAMEIGVGLSKINYDLTNSVGISPPSIEFVESAEDLGPGGSPNEIHFSKNDFFVISPSLRLQYNVLLNHNFQVTGHAGAQFNAPLEKSNFKETDFADVTQNTFNSSLKEWRSNFKNTNIFMGLGFERKFSRRGRLGIDLNYVLGLGNLIEGAFDENRIQGVSTKSNGYNFSGSGPMIRLRYYFGENV